MAHKSIENFRDAATEAGKTVQIINSSSGIEGADRMQTCLDAAAAHAIALFGAPDPAIDAWLTAQSVARKTTRA